MFPVPNIPNSQCLSLLHNYEDFATKAERNGTLRTDIHPVRGQNAVNRWKHI